MKKFGSTYYKLQRVVRTFKRTSNQIVHLCIGKDTIHTTPEHPFYVPQQEQIYASTENNNTKYSEKDTWILAKNLKKGAKVFLFSTLLATVDSTYTQDTTCIVYNFEVERAHNYFVGREKILVHNRCRELTLNDGIIELYQKNGIKSNPINSQYAGKLYPKNIEFAGKTYNGVPYDLNGFPDFRQFNLGSDIKKPIYAKFPRMLMDGDVSDFKVANEWLEKQKGAILNDLKASGATDITYANKSSSYVTVKYADGSEVNFTWHHHQDCETMMLVKQDIHSPGVGGVSHSGGRQVVQHNTHILKNGLGDSEDFLFFPSPY